MAYSMNPQRAKHMSEAPVLSKDNSDDAARESGSDTASSIHIDSHDSGHTVRIMHNDGTPDEKHEHDSGDVEGIVAHVKRHLGKSEDGDGVEDSDLMTSEDGDDSALSV